MLLHCLMGLPGLFKIVQPVASFFYKRNNYIQINLQELKKKFLSYLRRFVIK
jgi:hypothetical protein